MPTPCNGCTLCCQNDAVRLLPFEVDCYRHEVWAGVTIIAHQENGDCWYLDRQTGCTIHGEKPSRCKEMDCRNIYAMTNGKQARQMHNSGIITIDVWRKGRTLTQQYGKPATNPANKKSPP